MEGTWSQPNVGLHGAQQQLAPVGRPNWRMRGSEEHATSLMGG